MRRSTLFILIPLLAAACARKGSLRDGPASLTPPASAGAAGAGAGADLAAGAAVPPGVDVEEASLRGKQYAATADLQTVLFDYDAHQLSDSAREALQANASYLKGHPDVEVLVEGHCDARGTTQYNLALGQRRAKEVRDYYLRLGVPGKSVATISYGKEKLPCSDATEDCWSRSRRAETKARAKAAAKTPAKTPAK